MLIPMEVDQISDRRQNEYHVSSMLEANRRIMDIVGERGDFVFIQAAHLTRVVRSYPLAGWQATALQNLQ